MYFPPDVSAIQIGHHEVEKYRYRRKGAIEEASPLHSTRSNALDITLTRGTIARKCGTLKSIIFSIKFLPSPKCSLIKSEE
jgi:hypothetical protein